MIKTRREFEEKNARRIELIDKKFRDRGLSPEDREELEAVAEEVRDYIGREVRSFDVKELRRILAALRRGDYPDTGD